jgi:hypothetical protein
MKFDIWVFFESLSRNLIFFNLTRITDPLHEDRCSLLILSRSVIRRMRSVSDKICRGNQHTPMFSNSSPSSPLRKSCRLWDNMDIVESGKPQLTVWRMCFACCVHSQYVIRNTSCFSPATVVARTRLNDRLYVHCLSCYFDSWKQFVW